MKLLYSCLLFAALSLATSQAFAIRYDASCYGGNCAAYGWSIRELGGFYNSTTTCVNGNCFLNGWMVRDNAGNQANVRCRWGGCFKQGWENAVYTPSFNYLLRVDCWGGNCLNGGWRVNGPWGAYDVICMSGDCARVGWDAYTNGSWARAVCKNGNCFRYGWYTDFSGYSPINFGM